MYFHILCRSVITWSFSQSPVLIIIKVGISLHPLTRGIRMGQESIFTIKWVWVSMIWRDRNEILNETPTIINSEQDLLLCTVLFYIATNDKSILCIYKMS